VQGGGVDAHVAKKRTFEVDQLDSLFGQDHVCRVQVAVDNRRKWRGLDEALRHLVPELPVDLTPRLSGCKLLTGYLAEAQGPEAQRVAYALSRVRNDLAHGNKGFDAYDLHETVGVLERIVRAHALRLLGCSESVLERVCNLDR